MTRVSDYAKKVGGETIDDWLAGRTWSRELNKQWVKEMRQGGRKMIDVGPDFEVRLMNRANPPKGKTVYNMEREMFQGYDDYQQVFIREGKYQGGGSRIGLMIYE